MKKLLSAIIAAMMLISVMALSVSAEVYSQGDVNLENGVDVTDLTDLKSNILGVSEVTVMSDVNVDGKVNVKDLIRLKRIIARDFSMESEITQGDNTFNFQVQ